MQSRGETWFGSRRGLLGDAARLAAGATTAAALVRIGAGRVLAEGTPVAGAYPELIVTVTDQAIRVSTEQVPAGYVLLTAVNQSSSQTGVGIIGPGPGRTMDQLMEEASAPQPANTFLPPFFYTAALPGGPSGVSPGGTAQAIVHLTAGDWALFSASEEGEQAPAFITAAAGASSAQVAPEAAVTITEVDFAFGGLGSRIPAGKQTWQVVNQGTQPHLLAVSEVPPGTTLAQVLDLVSRPEDATPPPDGLRREDFQERGGVVMQSPGTTVWPLLDLPAGRYAALCFVGDPTHEYMSHAMEGMVAVFDVGTG
jgi:hypothetical protein